MTGKQFIETAHPPQQLTRRNSNLESEAVVRSGGVVTQQPKRGVGPSSGFALLSTVAWLALSGCGNGEHGHEKEVAPASFESLEQDLVVSVDVRVNGSNNDAEENSAGGMYLDSSDLELVTDGSRGAQVVGMRFQNVAIPRGASISAATLTFTVDETSSETTALTIRGHNVDDAPAFLATSRDLSSRPLTSAAVTWSPSAWSTVGQTKVSPNIGSVIAEITNRPGWASGNDIVLVVTGSGRRVAEAYDGVPGAAPLLHIDYESSAGCGNGNCESNETCSTCALDCGTCSTQQPTQQNLLIAFIGDQGNNANSTAVLQLIQAEGAAAVVHNGDFDYADNPTAWDNRITSVLGANYPYFAVIGNHDAAAWSGSNGYAAKIAQRHARNPEMVCTGELGVRANCNFRGLHLVESCVGTSELRSNCGANSADQVGFIQDSLASSNAVFKVCNWHKNQHDMQVGGKGNEVGWSAYQACVAAGAIISTGHEHSYSRTLTLTNVGSASNGHGATGALDVVRLGPQSSFVFVSGLAGVGRRAFQASHASDTWWASYYASDRWLKHGVLQSGGSNYGALFVRFHVDGNPKKAYAYFKDVSGRIVDSFTIYVD